MPPLKKLLFGAITTASPLGDFMLLVLRVSFGLYIAFGHGMAKIFTDNGLGPPQPFVEGVGALGFPMPIVFAWCAALAEFGCGLLVALGLLTRPAAAILAFNMAVAAFMQHWDDPWTSGAGASKEMAILYLVPFLTFMVLGAGRFGIDALFRRRG